MTSPVGVGIVGCGAISDTYFENLAKCPGVCVMHAADIAESRAHAAADKYGIGAASGIDDLLANEAVELVVNLTVPLAHADVSLLAIAAGKWVYSEKPLAASRDDGRRILDAAAAAGVQAGAAPDTFYGPGLQTARRLADAGAIGDTVGGAAFMLSHGHESWHPAPEFYYKRGGGPLFDMGPYYLTALVSLLGPVAHVQATSAITFPSRTITSEPLRGSEITVEVPTHITAILEFVSGAAVSLTLSFDVWSSQTRPIQLWGTDGSMILPDPNGFGGEVLLWERSSGSWRTEGSGEWVDWRGIGVADMARTMRCGEGCRADGALSFHVLDVMESIIDAGRSRRGVAPSSTCNRPRPLSVEDAQQLMGQSLARAR